jgi:hypothetical protein
MCTQHMLNTGPADWWMSEGAGAAPRPGRQPNGAKDLRSGSRTSMDATDAQARP